MINAYRFGVMQVQNSTYGKDLVILPSRIVPNWRRLRGHVLDLADIRVFLDEIGDVVVIGTGLFDMMKVSDNVIQELERHGISVVVFPTSKAWKQFNKFHSDGANVTGMFHLTC